MSGGKFNYDQYKIKEIADDIQELLDRQGKEIPDDGWCYSYDGLYETYPEEVQEAMKKGVEMLRVAHIYAQRIDWFLSGDDGEESFRKRLREDLMKLSQETHGKKNTN